MDVNGGKCGMPFKIILNPSISHWWHLPIQAYVHCLSLSSLWSRPNQDHCDKNQIIFDVDDDCDEEEEEDDDDHNGDNHNHAGIINLIDSTNFNRASWKWRNSPPSQLIGRFNRAKLRTCETSSPKGDRKQEHAVYHIIGRLLRIHPLY